jgi:hypothetical protein
MKTCQNSQQPGQTSKLNAHNEWKFTVLLVYLLIRVEAGSNTSTVTLWVVRGDEMGLKKAVP